jgi:RNA polymerase sigma-70 factor, ECF subfamily
MAVQPFSLDAGVEPKQELSFEDALRGHYDQVHRMVAHLLGPGAGRADIEDVTQLVFEAAYRAWPKFRGASLPSTWNVRRRLSGGDAPAARLRPAPALRARPEEGLDRAARLPDAGGAPAAAPAGGAVWRCLMEIKPKKRVVYVMHDLEGRSAQEIAQILEIPKDTVWSRLRHARAELLAKIEKLEAQEVIR